MVAMPLICFVWPESSATWVEGKPEVSHGARGPIPPVYNGQVTDGETGEPVVDAYIIIVSHGVTGTLRTDQQGRFKVEYAAADSHTGQITVIAEGYAATSLWVDLTESQRRFTLQRSADRIPPRAGTQKVRQPSPPVDHTDAADTVTPHGATVSPTRQPPKVSPTQSPDPPP